MWDAEFGKRVQAASEQERGETEGGAGPRRSSRQGTRQGERVVGGRDGVRVSGLRRTVPVVPTEPTELGGKAGTRKSGSRPPVLPQTMHPESASVGAHNRQTGRRLAQGRSTDKRAGKQAEGGSVDKQAVSSDGGESPTLAEGVVTRSMARRMQTKPRVAKPSLSKQSSTESTRTVIAGPSRSHSADEAPVMTHQAITPRHVRRSPQFNYDRFIPARSPEPSELRRIPRASSPVFSRPARPEHTVQTDEANRTYDALLRSELLNDRAVGDDFSPRMRPSSPNNWVPSLVPWSGGPSSSGPATPPQSPPRAPVFMYRSPRKASAAASMPALRARNLFGRASPVHETYQSSALTPESRRLLSPREAPRRIARDPIKVLDAPGIRDDYYLNLMDWASSDRVAVALDTAVYIWDAATSTTTELCDVGTGDWVTSVGWAENGKHLAVGLNSGTVQIWDANRSRRIRTLAGHVRRVGAVHWNGSVVSTASRDKRILNFDTRMRQNALVSTYYGHSQEVCGVRWSPCGTQLASGGNDNLLLVWDTRFTPLDARASVHPDISPGPRGFRRPLFRLTAHEAAVKALAWSPAQSMVLASGGGSDDRCIRVWDTRAGRQLVAHDTKSQVCNLSWSHDGNELVSTHGYSENHVVVWKYPAMQPVSVLTGHTKRVLYLAHSPDGQTIATAAGDETIRFWDVFPKHTSTRMPTSMSHSMRSRAGPAIALDDLAHIR
ncbi:substrate-specific activator of APC-dependent proteolysis [Coemansia sp. RSA 638]|nr:substrate-specific activator of APC-dependent proteolysis [Coemansia sp. RSA 638]